MHSARITKRTNNRIFGTVVGMCFLFGLCPERAFAETHLPWSLTAGAGAGWVFPEGDEVYESGPLVEAKLGYRFQPHLSVEGYLGYLPYLDNRDFPDNRFAIDDNTWALKPGVDLLYHLNREEEARWNPFLSAGLGGLFYEEALDHDRMEMYNAVGFGVNHYFDPNWFARADYKFALAWHDTSFGHHALLSFGYRWGESMGLAESEESSAGGMVSKSKDQLQPVYFPFDSSALSGTAKQTLSENAAQLEKHDHSVTLEGHCDERGTDEYNMALGERRARSVYDYLRARGISPNRMNTISYGEERPAAPGHNEEAWAKNRRVECRPKK